MSEEAEAQILAEIANVAEDGMCKAENGTENLSASAINTTEIFDDPGTPLGDEYQVPEDSEEEDDIQITIGDIRTNVTTFRPSAGPGGQRGGIGAGTGKPTQKLDMDATAEYQGSQLYDLELAAMEDKPWRKPGSDITDFFNYGFTEETWLIYCERQKKLRVEFGSAAAANRAFFSSISIAGMPSVQQQSTVVAQSTSSSQHQQHHRQQPSLPLIMRTVLTGPQQPEVPPGPAYVLTPAVPAPQQQPQQADLPHVPVQTGVQSVPSLASNFGISNAMLHNLQQLQRGGLSASPPNSPGMTPPPADSDEFSAGAVSQFSAGFMPPTSTVSSAGMAPPSLQTTQAMPPSAAFFDVPPTSAMSSGETTSGQNIVTVSSTTSHGPPGPFPDMTMPPPLRFPPTNLPPPGFPTAPPPTSAGSGMPLPPMGMPPHGMPPPNLPPPMFPPGSMPHPGVSLRFPPPFRFPPPAGPRMPSFNREAYVGFNASYREEARSPASYSDKSSDDESSRHERFERHKKAPNLRVDGSEFSRRDGGGAGYGGGGVSRDHRARSSRHHRSRSKDRRASSSSSRRKSSRERSEHGERSKHRRGGDEEEKSKRHKIKEEVVDNDESPEKSSSSRRRDKSDRKERSSSSKKKKKREKHDDDEAEVA